MTVSAILDPFLCPLLVLERESVASDQHEYPIMFLPPNTSGFSTVPISYQPIEPLEKLL